MNEPISDWRRKLMSRIKGRDTKPEMVIRRLLHGLGYRFRLCDPKLPGKPDIIFPKRRKVVFIHGCFWHRHSCRKGKSLPKTRGEFWRAKLERNKQRDRRTMRALRQLGWGIHVVWECQLKEPAVVMRRLVVFLEGKAKPSGPSITPR